MLKMIKQNAKLLGKPYLRVKRIELDMRLEQIKIAQKWIDKQLQEKDHD